MGLKSEKWRGSYAKLTGRKGIVPSQPLDWDWAAEIRKEEGESDANDKLGRQRMVKKTGDLAGV